MAAKKKSSRVVFEKEFHAVISPDNSGVKTTIADLDYDGCVHQSKKEAFKEAARIFMRYEDDAEYETNAGRKDTAKDLRSQAKKITVVTFRAVKIERYVAPKYGAPKKKVAKKAKRRS